MHIHILGVCGTFMGSLAQLAKALGHRVTGSDANVYPPMSTQLELAGIELIEGFDLAQLDLDPDIIVVGNVVSRGNPVMEAVLNKGLPFISGPQWLAEHVLQNRWVLAVAGTHGKTTTASMLAWILEYAGMAPGYLIGGVPGNFPTSASLGGSDFFVIEADEYDTAFFDKRSKFVHYLPRTLLINNLEFDHADIFDNLAAIQRQFHHLLRTVPEQGFVVAAQSVAIDEVLQQGCWSECQRVGKSGNWQYRLREASGSAFEVVFEGKNQGHITWNLSGLHNLENALGAIAAARHVGVSPELACAALCEFKGVKRRMELLATLDKFSIYDDFAHHPTAIASTLDGLRKKVGKQIIVAVIEPRSNTMKQGIHQQALLASVAAADYAFWFQNAGASWDLAGSVSYSKDSADTAKGDHRDRFLKSSRVLRSTDAIIEAIVQMQKDVQEQKTEAEGCHVVVMSNGGFEGLHLRLIEGLQHKAKPNKDSP